MIPGSRARTRIRGAPRRRTAASAFFFGMDCAAGSPSTKAARSATRAGARMKTERPPWWRQCVRCSGVSGACGGPEGRSGGFPMLQPGMDNPGQAGAVFHLFAEEVRAAAEQVEAPFEVGAARPTRIEGAGTRPGGLGGLGEVAAGELEQVAKLLHGDAHACRAAGLGCESAASRRSSKRRRRLRASCASYGPTALPAGAAAIEQARERLCVPFLQRPDCSARSTLPRSERGGAAGRRRGLEPGDLGAARSRTSPKRVLEPLDRPIELAQP